SLGQVLPKPRAVNYTIRSLYDSLGRGDIDLCPSYQRDVVWPDSKQRGLVESVFRHFHIPPLIFSDDNDDDSVDDLFVCIDGKQRLMALVRFMQGFIYCEYSRISPKLWYKNCDKNASKRLLPAKVRKEFDRTQLTCMEYDEVDEVDQHEIFRRVQLGMALTASERLAASNTHRSRFVRALLDAHFTEASRLTSRTFHWDNSRGADYRLLSVVLYVAERFAVNPYVTPDVPDGRKLSRWLSAADPITPSTQSALSRAFEELDNIAGIKELRRVWGKPRPVASIELAMFAILIFVHPDMSRTDITELMAQLRRHIRARHTTIRSTMSITQAMVKFVSRSATKRRALRERRTSRKHRMEITEEDDSDHRPTRSKRRKT
ncbi:hypothetical protein EV715DRAFT_187433, partial [Schizophyllum commune]